MAIGRGGGALADAWRTARLKEGVDFHGITNHDESFVVLSINFHNTASIKGGFTPAHVDRGFTCTRVGSAFI